MAEKVTAKLANLGESTPAKSLILLGEGSGEGGEGGLVKSLKSLRRGLAKVARRSTPYPMGTFARPQRASESLGGHRAIR